ncbi:hypothetical protein, partial [Saccharothrix sp. ST-888]|uniref:hypothetical protein n=1 Tax=Saccharothrix sp. ST-888 TaxID=1427391 RepID=UPI000ADAD319
PASCQKYNTSPGWTVVASYFTPAQNPMDKAVQGIVASPGSYPAHLHYTSPGVELAVLGGAGPLNIALALDPVFSADPAADRLLSAFSAGLGGIRLTR